MNRYLFRRIALAAIFALLYSSLVAQHFCRMPGHPAEAQGGGSGSASFEAFVRRFVARGGHLDATVKTIPVVVHVLYRDAADSISIERVASQIEALNRDFRKLNADTVKTRAAFKPVAADCHVEFCLATLDPSGQPTTGVTYVNLDHLANDTLHVIQQQTVWAPQRYLNIWVDPRFFGGNSSWPWALDLPGVTDGIVVMTRRFGTFGELDGGFNEGGVGTHEVGHYLGLYHTFHDGVFYNGQCHVPCDSTGDYVCDTPMDWEWPFGTEQCLLIQTSCFVDAPDSTFLIQNENFMAYSFDTCTNLFTLGQRIRIRATLDSLRAELVSEANLIATGCQPTSAAPGAPVLAGLRLFPVPTTTAVTIDFGTVLPRATVRVLTPEGRHRHEQSVHATQQLTLQVAGWPPGLYWVVVEMEAGRVTRKLVVGR